MKPSKHNTIQSKRLSAMTLTELLVVLAIIGILILVAYPILTPLFQKARHTEAKTNLVHLSNLQKVYYMEHATYSPELKKVGYQQEQLQSEGGKAHYLIEIKNAGKDNFQARAVSITDFDGDGIFNVWEVDKAGIPNELIED